MQSTVIICTKNYGQYISKALDSVKGQNVVVVDDASTDNTEEIVKQYAVEYIRLPNSQGPSNARNQAITHSWDKTDLWFVLDADDHFLPSKIEKFTKEFEDPNVGIVYGDYTTFSESGPETRVFKEPFDRARLFQECIIHSGATFSKIALERIGIKKGNMVYDSVNFPYLAEDWDLWLRLTKGSMAVHIPENLTMVRGHNNNLSRLTQANQADWNKSWSLIQQGMQSGRY